MGCFDNFARTFKRFLPDRIYLKLAYKRHMGERLNLKDPKRFNEKMQWLKLYDRKPVYTKMVDKYEAKALVEKIVGSEYVIPTLKVVDCFSDINFDVLPDQFVMKTTHDSGSVVICKNKKTIDCEAVEKKLNKSLDREYFYVGREWPYKNVKPRIIVEEYISDQNHKILPVYKFFCFNGIPKIVQVIQNDKSENESIDYYDMYWNELGIRQNYPNSKAKLEKPELFEEMKEIVKKLSVGIPFVRVDLYNASGRIYFSEFTFYSDCGFEKFYPDEWDYTLGEWITIPKQM